MQCAVLCLVFYIVLEPGAHTFYDHGLCWIQFVLLFLLYTYIRCRTDDGFSNAPISPRTLEKYSLEYEGMLSLSPPRPPRVGADPVAGGPQVCPVAPLAYGGGPECRTY